MKELLIDGKRKVAAATSVFLASLALAACGKDTSKSDTGSNVIGSCPPHYVYKYQPQVQSRSEFKAELSSAAVQLSSMLGRNGFGDALVRPNNPTSLDELRITAAKDVFYIADRGSGVDYFQTDSPQTKINDLNEEFCVQDGRTYVAPNTANAVGAMEAAGVKLGFEITAAVK